MAIPFPTGFETHISFAICMTESRESGHFTYDAATDTVQLIWSESEQEPAIAAARSVFDQLNAASGSSYRTDLFGGQEFNGTGCYHPIGGNILHRRYPRDGRIMPSSFVVVFQFRIVMF